MFKHNHRFSSAGFTLIELLVAIMILAVITVTLIILFDPLAQLNKAKDAQRKQDLLQIKSALDAYFNDNNCYPQAVPFGSSWQVGGMVYMKKVPQDASCTKTSGYCYIYQIDTNSSCPQWNILYAKLSKKPANPDDWCSNVLKTACSNANQSVSLKYAQGLCLLSGDIDCNYSLNLLPTPIVPQAPTIAPPTPTPTTPPIPGVDCSTTGHGYNAISESNGVCNSFSPEGHCLGHGGTLQCWSQDNCTGAPCN